MELFLPHAIVCIVNNVFQHLQSFFAERFFHIFEKEKRELISLKELREGLSQLICGSEMDKLRFLFQVYDIDGKYASIL